MESDDIDIEKNLSTDLASSSSADQACAAPYPASAAPYGDEGDDIRENTEQQVNYRRERASSLSADQGCAAPHQACAAPYRACAAPYGDEGDDIQQVIHRNKDEGDDADGASEDYADAAMEARVHKVTYRSRRHESVMEKLENHQFGELALHPTKVMVQYQRGPPAEDSEDMLDSVEEITADSQGCLQSIPEIDVHKHLKSETEVFISDGSSPVTKVSIDLHVTSLICENGLLRHFVGKQSTSGKPAAEMELCKEDELLLLNDEVLVDLSVDEMEALFFTLKVGTEFTMLTRRMVEQQESGYEYWQITTIIKLGKEDGEIVAEVAYLLRNIPEPGSIKITAVDREEVYIRCKQGYLKNVNWDIEIAHLDEDDKRFQFDLLEYHGYIYDDPSKPTNKTFCMLRYSKDEPVGFPTVFLYADDNKVEFKASNQSEPTREDVQNGTQWGDFSLHNAVFLKRPVNEDENTGDFSDDYVFLESYKQRGFFLKMEPQSVSLVEESELLFIESARFNISTCQT